MKARSEIIKSWECPKCGRQFERRGQSHSCRSFPLENHFIGKDAGKKLYDKFKSAAKKKLGPFKIESLECCIHFVSTFTFAAVKVFKNKIRIDFSLNSKIQNKKIKNSLKLSLHRFLYFVDITNENEINEELLEWIMEAKNKKSLMTEMK